MTLDPALAESLVRVIAGRERQRAEQVGRRWTALSRREQRLVREAAVMGYVQGVRSQPGSHSATIPPDSSIVATVISGCLDHPDLYPTIHRAGSRRRG